MSLLQLKITLQNISPKIWRRFVVSGDSTMYELHHIIQAVMGWENSHLYSFMKGDTSYVDPRLVEINPAEQREVPVFDFKVTDIFEKKGDEITYEYDFGDSWHHKVICEKFLTRVSEQVPFLLDGKGNCPPEDIGGAPAMMNIIRLYRRYGKVTTLSLIEGRTKKYNPLYFDIAMAQKRLELLPGTIKKYDRDLGGKYC